MTRPDENKDKASFELSDEELKKIVAEADTGGRKPTGFTAQLLLMVALAWSLFQLWIASPLPFSLGVFVFNDTESRAIHLAFAIFLAFAAYPALKRSPRDYVPVQDWVLAAVAAFCAAYLFLFYKELAQRPGTPTDMDLAAAVVGMLLLLEAARRALGLPMVILAAVFLVYIFFGPYMPDVIAHRGASLAKGMSHMWLTTEGVFGVAVGVSTSFIFLFVLFGALLEPPAPAPTSSSRRSRCSATCVAARPRRRWWPRPAPASSPVVDRQRGHHRHLHHPADEERGLPRRQGRGGRGVIVGQRPDHAAGDGRGGLPDGRVRRHHLRAGDEARDPAGADLVHRAVLHRAPRSPEDEPAGPAAARATAVAAGDDLDHDDRLRPRHPVGDHLLGFRLAEDRVR
jgi:TRAP-type uncharacterized transport system, fused permease components